MSTYWKQSLWIGGVYWVLSQFINMVGSVEAYLTNALFSVILLLFLIAMNKLSPIGKIDNVMRKMPILSTFLVSVGWIPYFIGLTFVVMLVFAFVIAYSEAMVEPRIVEMITVFVWIENIRKILFILFVLLASFYVLIMRKTVVGCLDKKYRLTVDSNCEIKNIGEAAKNSAKVMYECKKVKDHADVEKQIKKSVAKKSTSKVVKRNVKEAEEKASTKKKVEKKPVKKIVTAKKKSVKKNIDA